MYWVCKQTTGPRMADVGSNYHRETRWDHCGEESTLYLALPHSALGFPGLRSPQALGLEETSRGSESQA